MDKRIICTGCSSPFNFNEADQKYYAAQGFQPPKRCQQCRGERKSKPKRQKPIPIKPAKRREPEIIRLRPMLSSGG